MNAQAFKRTVSFLDAEGHRAKITCEITHHNGFPHFSAWGEFLSASGQCLDRIKPRNEAQKWLIQTWKDCHLKNIKDAGDESQGFTALLNDRLDAIEEAEEEEIKLTDKSTDEQLLKQMEEYGIDEDELEACRAYVYAMGADNLAGFEEAYCGEYDDKEEFAQEQAEACGDLERNPRWPYNCIDWEQAARELMYDYTEHDGFYFRMF